MELAFAGLHQLCTPLLDRLPALPAPQRDALRIAFGISTGPVPDTFLIALAVLGLLSEAADRQPLLCVVDDQQWLDEASARVLGLVARRLAADPVGLVFAARYLGPELAGLPELVVGGLDEDDSRSLLESVLTGPLDAQVKDLVIAETRGNPLALLELPRGLTPEQLAGGFGLPTALSPASRVEDGFLRQFEVLPPQARRLVVLMAAEPSGDPALLWRTAARLGIAPRAAEPLVWTGLVQLERGDASGIRWPAQRPTSRRRATTAARCTPRWRRPPTRLPTLTAGPGTVRRRRRARTKPSPRNSNGRPGAPRLAAGCRLLPPSWNARHC